MHKERPFYRELVEFMSSGPIIAAILEKDNAVNDFRTLIGATDPAKAAEGTIRKLFATSVGENAVHGSDSDENAKIEGGFYVFRAGDIDAGCLMVDTGSRASCIETDDHRSVGSSYRSDR